MPNRPRGRSRGRPPRGIPPRRIDERRYAQELQTHIVNPIAPAPARIASAGQTYIHYPSKVSTLLDAGANPNTAKNGGVTPLHLALSIGAYKLAWQ